VSPSSNQDAIARAYARASALVYWPAARNQLAQGWLVK